MVQYDCYVDELLIGAFVLDDILLSYWIIQFELLVLL